MSSSSGPIEFPESDNESDSSQALLDLVRIGEASRLRRRGAMRLDLSTASTSVGAISAPDEQLATLVLASEAQATPVTRLHRLYCGARDWTVESDTASALPCPLPEPLQQDEDQDRGSDSGCGALVHDAATPSIRDGTWFARGRATSTVVPLDEAYFERGGRQIRRPCGCTSDGVGCCVCGNPLGSVWRPCSRHEKLFSSGDMPVYWFFTCATEAVPSFVFPPPVVGPPPLNTPREPNRHPISPHTALEGLPLESPKI